MIQGIENMILTREQEEAICQGLKRNTTLRTLRLSHVNMSALSASLTVNNTLQDLELTWTFLNDH